MNLEKKQLERNFIGKHLIIACFFLWSADNVTFIYYKEFLCAYVELLYIKHYYHAK